jgi:hypothetical protein
MEANKNNLKFNFLRTIPTTTKSGMAESIANIVTKNNIN